MSRDVDYIVAECHEFASNNNLDFEWESGTLYPYNITVRFINTNTKAGYKVKSFKYNDIIHTPEEFVRDIITELTNMWFREEKEEPKPTGDRYRDKLVEQIRAAGQDLIDRAGSFVAKDLKMIGGFNIEIDIPQDGPVEIVTRMKTYSMNDEYYKTNVLYADDKPVLTVKGE